MASGSRPNRYSQDPSRLLNPLPTEIQRGQTVDRTNQLYQMSMSNEISSHAKLRKRNKIKGQLTSADYVAFFPGDGRSEFVVSERKGGRILVFRNEAKTGQELISGIKPRGVACLDASSVVLVDENANEDKPVIKILSIGDGASPAGSVVAQWSNNSTNCWQPRGVAVTKAGQIVVTNIHPDAEERFRIYSADGQESSTFGRAQGPADLIFRSPSYVAADEFGRILASDTDGNCVKIFDGRGRYVGEFGNTAGGDLAAEKDRKLLRPMGLVCDSRGNIIVCDSGNRRLAMFSQDGRFIQTLRQPQKMGLSPVDVAMNSSSDRLVFSVHDRTDGFWKLVSYSYVCN